MKGRAERRVKGLGTKKKHEGKQGRKGRGDRERKMEGMEDKETLKTGTVVGQLTDSVEHIVDDLLADGVVATSVVVCRVFFASDELLGVVEL